MEVDGSANILVSDLIEIERFSVNIRYPGVSADKEEAKSAYHGARFIRDFFRQKLGMK
jgi:hypothetical protein